MLARLRARVFIACTVLFLAAFPHSGHTAPPPIEAFVQTHGVGDIALSPDGAWIAAAQYTSDNEHAVALMIYRVDGSRLTLHKSAKFEHTRLYDLAWANEERLLATVQNYDPKTGSALTVRGIRLRWRPPQIVSMNADLEDPVLLLKDERDFRYTVDKSEILHWLPSDPRHVLMEIYDSRGKQGLNIYKVNVYDGKAEVVERGHAYTNGWMVDTAGNVRLRVDNRYSSTIFYARNAPGEDWFEISRFRRRETPPIRPLAFSSDPNILYVAAYHQDDRLAIFEYRMKERALGRLVFAHPEVDVKTVLFTQPDKRLVGFRYVVHKPQGHYLDEWLQGFERKLERSFGAENFVRPVSASRDGRLVILGATGPRDAGSYYLYDTAANRANLIGAQSAQLLPEQMGAMKPLVYKARDGVEITAYFTTPPGNPSRPPLVVMPHGGPAVRDSLGWDTWVQFLATRGYAVLQPNFRGSSGYGKKFEEAGHGQWGLKMQDDVTDGVRHVVEAGLVDGERICILGASYGGYAALAGAAFTPDLYKCAVSINGVADLYDMMHWERRRKTEYHYWQKSVGDLGRKDDRNRMKARSPARHVDGIKAPILLIAGEDDDTVDADQSRNMAKALKAAGKPHEYIEFEDEGHTIRRRENRQRMLAAMERFLDRHIGRTRSENATAAAAR